LRTLAGGTAPHPEIVAACEDLDVLGVVFYLMEDVAASTRPPRSPWPTTTRGCGTGSA
jgi:aminoglycoside phosphotransferase (APT) family kinase protein